MPPVTRRQRLDEELDSTICDDVAQVTGITEARVLRPHVSLLRPFSWFESVVAGKLEVSLGHGNSVSLDYYYRRSEYNFFDYHVHRYPYEGTAKGFWRWLRHQDYPGYAGGNDLNVERRFSSSLVRSQSGIRTHPQDTIGLSARGNSSISADATETKREDLAVSTRVLSTPSFSSSTDTAPPSCCPLYGLPPELRVMIYQYTSFDALIVKRLLDDSNREIILAPQIAAVAQAGNTLRREVDELLFKEDFTFLPSLTLLPPSAVSDLDGYKAQLGPSNVVCFNFHDIPEQEYMQSFGEHLRSWLSICPVRVLFHVPSYLDLPDHIQTEKVRLFIWGIKGFSSYVQSCCDDCTREKLHVIVKQRLRLHKDLSPTGNSEFMLYYELEVDPWKTILHCLRDQEDWAEHAIIKDFAKPTASTAVMRDLGWTRHDSVMMSDKERDVLRHRLPDMNRLFYPMPWKQPDVTKAAKKHN